MAGKGRRVDLPIVGLSVTEICFGQRGPVVLTFGELFDTRIRIEEAITLSRGRAERVMTGARPGTTFNIAELGPVLEVFGLPVLEAVAGQDGTLRLRFRGDLTLSVVPSTGYEAWHFASPKLRLDGAHGRLL